MPLQLPAGGDATPYIRFMPSLNAWEMSTAEGREEFAFDKPAVFDIQNVQLGWLLLAEGQRDWQPWPGNKMQPKPAEGEYKPGFEVNVYSTQMFGDEPVRSFSNNGTGATMFIQALYNEAEKHEEFAAGKSPVVQITGSTAIKVGKKGGATRVPQFQIVKWIDRPQALGANMNLSEGSAAPAPKAAAKAAPAPAPAAASAESEF
jgi:hypothetical protein